MAGIVSVCLLLVPNTLNGSGDDQQTTGGRAQSPPDKVLLGHGSERLPSESAADWVRNAEFIVEVGVVSESAHPVPEIDLQRGEGMILRDLELEVESVVWSATGTGIAPKTLRWGAFGWYWKGDPGQRQELGVYGAPRMEVGHTYLLALDLPPAKCANVDTVNEASRVEWLGLGGSSVVPIDGGIVGNGEFEGVDDGLTRPAENANSVLAQTQGAGLTEVRDLLRKVTRTTPPGPASRTCD